MTEREALKHLKATIEAFGPDEGIELDQKAWRKLHSAIKEALMSVPDGAQQEQSTTCGEPVATLDDLEQEIYENTRQFVSRDVMEWMLKRYYTAPPTQCKHCLQRTAAEGEDTRRAWVGLTDEEIGAILEGVNAYGTRLYTFARAIEAAHGIKE